jgi:hypothetical protein
MHFAFLVALLRFFNPTFGINISERTPRFGGGHSHRRHRDRAKPPNDGRWHMKFHRSRI